MPDDVMSGAPKGRISPDDAGNRRLRSRGLGPLELTGDESLESVARSELPVPERGVEVFGPGEPQCGSPD